MGSSRRLCFAAVGVEWPKQVRDVGAHCNDGGLWGLDGVPILRRGC